MAKIFKFKLKSQFFNTIAPNLTSGILSCATYTLEFRCVFGRATVLVIRYILNFALKFYVLYANVYA